MRVVVGDHKMPVLRGANPNPSRVRLDSVHIRTIRNHIVEREEMGHLAQSCCGFSRRLTRLQKDTWYQVIGHTGGHRFSHPGMNQVKSDEKAVTAHAIVAAPYETSLCPERRRIAAWRDVT
jgi:hypothetical protein